MFKNLAIVIAASALFTVPLAAFWLAPAQTLEKHWVPPGVNAAGPIAQQVQPPPQAFPAPRPPIFNLPAVPAQGSGGLYLYTVLANEGTGQALYITTTNRDNVSLPFNLAAGGNPTKLLLAGATQDEVDAFLLSCRVQFAPFLYHDPNPPPFGTNFYGPYGPPINYAQVWWGVFDVAHAFGR